MGCQNSKKATKEPQTTLKENDVRQYDPNSMKKI
jgi:hypothetical protein